MPLYPALGTAATKNTGTSGDAIPVLNGAATTWANGATFGGDTSVSKAVNATVTFSLSNSDTTNSTSRAAFTFVGGSVQGRLLAINGDAFYFGTTVNANFYLQHNNLNIVEVAAAGIDVTGLARCDTLRIDAAPTAETPTATHTAVINLNGTNYKFLCLAA